MAGDWLPMRHDLREDPAVIAITAAVEGLVDEDHTCGKLLLIWAWADKQTLDGNAPSVTAAFVDRHLGMPGFAQAMAKVQWLVITSEGITFPRFDRYISQTAKQRALTAKRAKKYRAKSNGGSVTKSAPTEQKRTEESKSLSARADDTPQTPQTAKDDELLDAERRFITLWNSLAGVCHVRGDTFGEARRKHFRARMKDGQWQNDVRPAFAKFPLQSTVGDGEWKPDMDFILRPNSLTAILEGKYDWTKGKGNQPPPEDQPTYVN